MPPILDITDLTKRFGDLTANDGVTLDVQPGEVVGLLGHNGGRENHAGQADRWPYETPCRPDHGEWY